MIKSTNTGEEVANFIVEKNIPLTWTNGDTSHTDCRANTIGNCIININREFLGYSPLEDTYEPDLGNAALALLHEGQHARSPYAFNTQWEEYNAYLSEDSLRVELQNKGINISGPRDFSMITNLRNPTRGELEVFIKRNPGLEIYRDLPVFPWEP